MGQFRLRFEIRVLQTRVQANQCASGPCQNGGTCTNTYTGFHCECRSAFEVKTTLIFLGNPKILGSITLSGV